MVLSLENCSIFFLHIQGFALFLTAKKFYKENFGNQGIKALTLNLDLPTGSKWEGSLSH